MFWLIVRLDDIYLAGQLFIIIKLVVPRFQTAYAAAAAPFSKLNIFLNIRPIKIISGSNNLQACEFYLPDTILTFIKVT